MEGLAISSLVFVLDVGPFSIGSQLERTAESIEALNKNERVDIP